jgi:hypothetical protein
MRAHPQVMDRITILSFQSMNVSSERFHAILPNRNIVHLFVLLELKVNKNKLIHEGLSFVDELCYFTILKLRLYDACLVFLQSAAW